MPPSKPKLPHNNRQRPSGPKPRLANPDPARHAAVGLLTQVLSQKSTLDDAMRRVEAYARLDGRDRGFAAHITLACLRGLGLADAAIGQRLEKPLPESAIYARNLLRLGAIQLIEGLAPPHAVVGTAVALAKAEPSAAGFAGLINAVLRRISEDPQKGLNPRFRVPAVWWNRWRGAYGAPAADAIANSLATQPPMDFSSKGDPASVAELLGGLVLPTGSVRVDAAPPDVTALPGWAEGGYWVQDAAAALPARILAVQPGEHVLDLCAAPGGKTMQLAATGASVTAMDLDAGRLNKVTENLARTGLNAQVLQGDGRSCGEALYDAILLDAPCSASGTLRRNPETILIKQPSDVAKFPALQAELVAAAARALKPGGRLVYAVCSLEPEEAASGVEAAHEAGLEPMPIRHDELPGLEAAVTGEGYARVLPGHWAERGGIDGFFIARFAKP
jgi:16S rRNA (cytosine967-C5)-methyltransferase